MRVPQTRRIGIFFASELWVSVSLTVAATAFAQTTAREIVRPDLIDRFPNFSYNKPIDLKTSRDLPPRFFKVVHVYALRAPGGEPQVRKETPDCFVYDAVRLDAQPCVAGLCLGYVNQQWLKSGKGGAVEEETYLLVFEIDRPIDYVVSPASGSELVSIRKADKQQFLSHAVKITIRPPSPSIEEAGLLSGVRSFLFGSDGGQKQEAGTAPVAVDLDNVTCLQIVYTGAEDMNIAYLRPCNRSDS